MQIKPGKKQQIAGITHPGITGSRECRRRRWHWVRARGENLRFRVSGAYNSFDRILRCEQWAAIRPLGDLGSAVAAGLNSHRESVSGSSIESNKEAESTVAKSGPCRVGIQNQRSPESWYPLAMSEVAGGSLPRSDSSVAMEASAPSSSTSSPPSSPSDGPRRLTVTQLEQLRVEEEVFEIYRILRSIAPHTQSFM
ncbi:hypothetical protein GW17_00033900 [Ensete ventricosum]|nr:hypothetical protein GW17_00033900 [Ensete ventricosum]